MLTRATRSSSSGRSAPIGRKVHFTTGRAALRRRWDTTQERGLLALKALEARRLSVGVKEQEPAGRRPPVAPRQTENTFPFGLEFPFNH
ncbi:hypothetical protein EYF80_054323 [Liparis tanakae]|uniref:Uncharacterized protein n=1 Tax=Liparis tanakae TaxID=230148 RepID=A0A4Z2F2R1_9TELE|nr:hypothetical protein EYF80_054323 [Liparis tanakae]